MSDWHFVSLILLIVGTAALATSAPHEGEISMSGVSMETLDLSKAVEGDKRAEANSEISFNIVRLPRETGKNRQQYFHDIVERDKQRLQYFASRIERAKSENSQNQPPKLKDLTVDEDGNGGAEEEQIEKTSNSGSISSN